MKYSNNYVIYPDNKPLEKALEHFHGKLSDPVTEHIKPDSRVTVPDNFTHTRGNFEQHLYRTTILEPAREVFATELSEEFRQQDPLEWALTQNHLGNILAAQGQQMRDEQLFTKSIEAFNNALEVLNQETTPSDWAGTQYNLATAAQAIGRLQSDSKLLKQAVDAYTNALLVWNREQTPLEWATTMHQLGATFHTHGLLLKGNRTLQKSVVAYKNALAVFDADNHALELAATHNNRGAALQHLAESEDNAERVDEAIRSYETGLLVIQEQQLPIHLAAMCKVNIATARTVKAELTTDSALAQEAADDFDLIIELFRGSLQPLCLKHCEVQLNHSLALAKA